MRLPRLTPRHRLRLGLLISVAMVPLVLWAALPVLSSGSAGAQLSSKIDQKRKQIAKKKGRERVLSSTVATYSHRIGKLQSNITVLQRKQITIQTDLDAKRSELDRIQENLRLQRLRLARLRKRLAEARVALSTRLVELYKADKPDVVTVVLDSHGFADLLERTEFMQRVSEQDGRIIKLVRSARTDATQTAARLDGLQKRQTIVAAAIQSRRDEVAAVKGRLVDQRQVFATVRDTKARALASTRTSRQHLEGDLAALVKENAAVEAKLRAATPGVSGGPAGPVRPGSGGLIWPVNGPIVSPFGMRWGRLHAGVDIAVPSGTPIRAAASGRVVLLGWTGGYGNYTCIQHSGALSTCYAHQASYATSMGANVSQGDVIGYSDCTGHCFGPHVHFETRINGTPVNPMGYL